MTVSVMAGARDNAQIVRAALQRSRMAFVGVGVLSAAINVLALTGSLYMLQVYDRVIPSRSIPTLVGLTVVMVGLYLIYGFLDLVRTRILARIGARLDVDLRGSVFNAVLLLPLRTRSGNDALQPVRDLDAIRAFLSSLGPTALCDMPWMPVYLGLVWLLHPILGMLAVSGALILIALTCIAEWQSAAPAKAAAQRSAERIAFADVSRRNAEVISAMGMAATLSQHWTSISGNTLASHIDAADVGSGLSTVSKIFRMLLQSAILGLGAFLVVQGEASGGVMIAASIMTSRALAPVEIAIAHWKGFQAARLARGRLEKLLAALPNESVAVDLLRPSRKLEVQSISVAAPGDTRPIIQNVAFTLDAGAGLGVIGPSASGKSTLAHALVGVWHPLPMRGTVRLDGATLDQYAPAVLGSAIGYLPQDIELFSGTIAENIARFDATASSEAIISAARIAGVHDMILQLPEGYGTRIGERGATVSAGQRQRIALARALYGDPFLIVLDEPNSNLDATGEAALTAAIRTMRDKGSIVIVNAHRPSALAALDSVLVMADGKAQAFGPKDEVLRKVLQTPSTGLMRVVPDQASGSSA